MTTAGGAGVVTTCGGCGAECGLRVTVDDDGRVVAHVPVEGHPSGAVSLCGRGRRRLRLPYLEEDRVTHPLRRKPDGSFEQISWDEAYGQIAERLRSVIDAHGPTALGCTTGVSSYHAWHARRLLHALGSPNIYTADGACEASRIAGWEHTLGYSPASDLANTDYIVYFGRSLMDSSSEGDANALRQAVARGASVVAVDPRRNSTAALASEWLCVRPGHDLALLLGIAHVLIAEDLYDHDFVARHTTGFEEFAAAMRPYTPQWAARTCDLTPDTVTRVARGLGRARPRSVIDCGFHGGIGVAYVNSVQTARMIALVDALLGDYGQLGGNLNPPTTLRLGELDPRLFPEPPVPQAGKVGADRYPLADPTTGLCTTIGESIELGELKALIAYASNPAMGYGNARDWLRMLGELDLLVAIDIRLSETARVADFVLPEVTFLESDRGVGVCGTSLYYRGRVLEPLHPDTRPANRIFRELACAMGVGEYFSFTEHDRALAQVAPFGVDLDELMARGFAATDVVPQPRTGEPVIDAPGGKISFASDLFAQVGLGRVPCWQPPLVEPGPGELRLIGGNNIFESHTSTHMIARANRPGQDVGLSGGAIAVGGTAVGAGPMSAVDAPRRHVDAVSQASATPARSQLSATGVWMNAEVAEEAGLSEGDVVEVASELGSDRAVLHLTQAMHPSALFTTSSPGGRSGRHARAYHASADALGVGPLDHTPLRHDRLTGAALTQENIVRVRKYGDDRDA